MGIERAEVIARMRAAFREGLSASRFMTQMRLEGLSYRRTTMLSDWRTVNEIERKEGAMRYVRKDRMPSRAVVATVDWEMSKEFMYKIKTHTRLKPGEPITERFVNIMSDVPLTPQQIESQVEERWGEWEKYAAEELVGLTVFSAAQRSALWQA